VPTNVPNLHPEWLSHCLSFMNPIIRPALLIHKAICQANIDKMVKKANRNHLVFRPHFKTHQSAEIGEWFRERGVSAITVSSVRMAKYFADHGWKDITIAFPCNILEIDEINELASRIRLNLLIESPDVASFLAYNINCTVGIFIKMDTGYHRTGIDPENILLVDTLLEVIHSSHRLEFRGFLTHTGQTYHAKGLEEIGLLNQHARNTLLNLKERYISEFPGLILSIGDTPSCSLLDEFPGIDEIRPGNFVFYDLMQFYIGSCKPEEIAVAIACPVVAVHPERNEAVIYGGAVHLSKEYCTTPEGNRSYGLVVHLIGSEWDVNQDLGYLTALSQEHGIIKLNEGVTLSAGDLVAVIPVHSCLAMDLMLSKDDGVRIIDIKY
jgi:D-serine deaminase-like pyridoxal phosphate-dependent protein